MLSDLETIIVKLDQHLMAKIKVGNLNARLSYLITTVSVVTLGSFSERTLSRFLFVKAASRPKTKAKEAAL